MSNMVIFCYFDHSLEEKRFGYNEDPQPWNNEDILTNIII